MPNCSQCSICAIEQGIVGNIVHRTDPLAFENTPKSFCKIEFWRIWRQIEQVQTSRLPYAPQFLELGISMHCGVIKYDKSLFLYPKRQHVQKIRDLIRIDRVLCYESLVLIPACNHSKDIQSAGFL